MNGVYAYTPAIWQPLMAAVFLAALSLYSWRRRSTHAALPLAIGLLFATLWLLGIALEVATVAPATKIAWHKFQAAWQLPTATAMACFALEYAYPGRWLTRRNLILLALPPFVLMLLLITTDAQFMWRRLEVAPDGAIVRRFAAAGTLLVAYGVSLGLVNVAAFLWLFIRSPQHRWPAALMLFGDLAGRSVYSLYALGAVRPSSLTVLDSFIAATLLNWLAYAIALFGFRILDPLPAARRTAMEQMREGMVVFDADWRVVRLNPAAATILGASTDRTRGKALWAILPTLSDSVARRTEAETSPLEISLGTGPAARSYTLSSSPLKDFRGLLMGHVLLLRDVTEQQRAGVALLEQQRVLAALREREQMARELHDGLGQVLGYVKLQTQAARSLLAQERKVEADNCLAQLASVAQDAHADVRDTIFQMSAASPLELGFRAALQQYLERFSQNYQIRTELEMPPELTDSRFEPAVGMQLLRIIQEALANARKHAHASQVRISLAARAGTAEVTITDDGQGFDPDQADGGGFGLRFMRERAADVGGRLQVRSAPGQGAQVVVEAPLRKDGNP